MVEKNDWRLQGQEEYLMQEPLKHSHWKCIQEGWDHDHCEFCWETIDTTTGPAYCTLDGRNWICETCFEDFKEMFQFEVVEEEGKTSNGTK